MSANELHDDLIVFDGLVNIAGEDAVGYGTDFTRATDRSSSTGSRATRAMPAGSPRSRGSRTSRPSAGPEPRGAMQRAGWPESKIRKVMGENWLRVLAEV
jgi:membrane dipeptidase